MLRRPGKYCTQSMLPLLSKPVPPTVSSTSSHPTSPTKKPPSHASTAPHSPSSAQVTARLSAPTGAGSALHKLMLALPAITLRKIHRTSSPAPHIPQHLVWETSGRGQPRWQISWPHCHSSDSGFLPDPPRNHHPLEIRERTGAPG